MKRILTAVVLIALVVALIFYGQLWMLYLLCAIVAVLAAHEYLTLANQTPLTAQRARIPAWWMAAAVVILFAITFRYPEAQLPVLSFLGLTLLAWSGFRDPLPTVLPNAALGFFGLIYIAYPLTLLPLLWVREDGTALLLFLLVCVWAGDIAALYIGKNFGRRKLAPRLSPNKTCEGAVASIAGSVLAALGLIGLTDILASRAITGFHVSEPLWQSILLAILVNIAAQVGDLLESAIKRGANVKDSGTLLPGHGGILDRIDALLLAAPVLWFALLLKDFFGLGTF